jgi:hypothetical protein
MPGPLSDLVEVLMKGLVPGKAFELWAMTLTILGAGEAATPAELGG